MIFSEEELLKYAFDRFEEGNYGEALEAFVLAYEKGLEQEWVLDNIYSCYMDGNDMAFRKAFEKQAYKIECGYDDCILDFIPCGEEEYFIFDKEKKKFLWKFSIQELKAIQSEPSFAGTEFSAAAVELDWDWGGLKSILAEAKNRKIYAICHDLNRAASFCKIPELEPYMDYVRMFSDRQEFQQYFHENTAVYMPLLVVGNETTTKDLDRILKEEHRYRLTPEGRNTENILLTIGIPTRDRGNLLLQRLENLRKIPYDAEIEIAISKNGMHYYQEEYESVKDIEDARITYVGYDKDLRMSQNWRNVVEIAHGRFVLMVSDEDDVILEALEHYLKFLNSHENLGYVRAKTVQQYCFISDSTYYRQGREAFLGGFLGQNYLSGAIYNRQLFLEANIQNCEKKYKDNTFYDLYPHVWWQSVLAFKGDYAGEAVCLIQEGDSVLLEETLKNQEDNLPVGEVERGHYNGMDFAIAESSTYSARIEQFCSGVSLIKEFRELDEELKAIAVSMFIEKTLFLMRMIRNNYGYKVEEFPKWAVKLAEEVMLATNDSVFSESSQQWIMDRFLRDISMEK